MGWKRQLQTCLEPSFVQGTIIKICQAPLRGIWLKKYGETFGRFYSSKLQQITKKNLQMLVPSLEIQQTMFSLDGEKAPGLDGFTACFKKKKTWPVIPSDVVHAIQSFFNSGRLLREVNATIMTLVHKVSNPSSVGQEGIIDHFFLFFFWLKYNL